MKAADCYVDVFDKAVVNRAIDSGVLEGKEREVDLLLHGLEGWALCDHWGIPEFFFGFLDIYGNTEVWLITTDNVRPLNMVRILRPMLHSFAQSERAVQAHVRESNARFAEILGMRQEKLVHNFACSEPVYLYRLEYKHVSPN